MLFALVCLAALAGGTIAAIAGFGIGSAMTPLLAMQYGMKLAVPMVAIPHIVGTSVRLWFLRRELDWHVLRAFGITSAIGGLAGALLQIWFGGRALAITLAVLLMFAGATGALGLTLRFGRRGAWIAGALSGLLGGLVGNQGGIRAGAMLGFDVPKEAFVATATAVALFVDLVRVPVYLTAHGRALVPHWPLIAAATVAVIAGTFLGRALLGRMREDVFQRVVSLFVFVLGVSMLFV